MAVEKRHVISGGLRDARSVEQKVLASLGSTPTTVLVLFVMAVLIAITPWSMHLLFPIGFIWWMSVAFDIDRKVLPLYLPKDHGGFDYNDVKPGVSRGYSRANGINFLGNAKDQMKELWETSSFSRQHKIILGTTGSGKTETMMGLFANFLLGGAGLIFSDAKGTKEQISKCAWLTRRFGRDFSFLVINYITGGVTQREGSRLRMTNTSNPTAFAGADQINQMFMSFLPKSSGENQMFQDRAVALFASLTPALEDLRDLYGEVLSVETIRTYIGSLVEYLKLAKDADGRLSPRAKASIRNFLTSAMGIDMGKFDMEDPTTFKVSNEGQRTFLYASQYFTRALASLVETYGNIYLVSHGEVDYKDAVFNRRIVIISLPAMDKSPQELNNIAKINIANIRGAIASASAGQIEGNRRDTLDNMPTRSEFPTGLGLDEYGYQAEASFPITTAQSRAANFSIFLGGQDFTNFQMGGDKDADALFGNAVLIAMGIRNTKEIGSRIQEASGQVDVATQTSIERDHAGLLSGYMDDKSAAIQRRYLVEASDLMALNYGEAFIFPGRNIGPIRYFPWAPLPDVSEELYINRFLAITDTQEAVDALLEASANLDKLVKNRLEGRGLFDTQIPLSQQLMDVLHYAEAGAKDPVTAYLDAIEKVSHARSLQQTKTRAAPVPSRDPRVAEFDPLSIKTTGDDSLLDSPYDDLSFGEEPSKGLPMPDYPSRSDDLMQPQFFDPGRSNQADMPKMRPASSAVIPPMKPVESPHRQRPVTIPPRDRSGENAAYHAISARTAADLFDESEIVGADADYAGELNQIVDQVDRRVESAAEASLRSAGQSRQGVGDIVKEASQYVPPAPPPPPVDMEKMRLVINALRDERGVPPMRTSNAATARSPGSNTKT